jgi:hypothetical protein
MWRGIKEEFYKKYLFYKKLFFRVFYLIYSFSYYYIPYFNIYCPIFCIYLVLYLKKYIIIWFLNIKKNVKNLCLRLKFLHLRICSFFILEYFFQIKNNIRIFFNLLFFLLHKKNLKLNLQYNNPVNFNLFLFSITIFFYYIFFLIFYIFLIFLKIYLFLLKVSFFFFINFLINILYLLLFIYYLIQYILGLTVIKEFFFGLYIMCFFILIGIFCSYCVYLWFNVFYWIPLQWEFFESCACHQYYHSYLQKINDLGRNHLTGVESARIFENIHQTCKCNKFNFYALFFILKPPVVENFCTFCSIIYIGFHYNFLFIILSLIFFFINFIICVFLIKSVLKYVLKILYYYF